MRRRSCNARQRALAGQHEGRQRHAVGTERHARATRPYSFKARFGDGKGTNPEELIAAAHAGCFTMALSFTLNNAGFTAEAIDTEAQLTMDRSTASRRSPRSTSTTRARVPDDRRREVHEIAAGAKANCVVSRALSPSIDVTLDATLA